MDIENLNQYLEKYVYLILKNGFKYKLLLKPEYIKNEYLSFPDKFGNLVSFNISEINFITISNDFK